MNISANMLSVEFVCLLHCLFVCSCSTSHNLRAVYIKLYTHVGTGLWKNTLGLKILGS